MVDHLKKIFRICLTFRGFCRHILNVDYIFIFQMTLMIFNIYFTIFIAYIARIVINLGCH